MADTISSIASLLWPLLVLAALLLFRRPLLRVVRSAEQREWTLEVGGQKLTMKQLSDQQNTMIADLQKQIGVLHRTVARLTATPSPLESPEPGGGITTAIPHAVLWVDDNPRNNALIVDQLQRSGVRVDLALSTREGLSLLGQNRYGIVLSDMGRVEDGTPIADAGLRLLRAVRETRPTLPFVIYSSRTASMSYEERAQADGATAITSSPAVVTEHLQSLGLLQ